MSIRLAAGGRIVVGVDGSPSSVAALRWAIGQADQTGAEVEVVTAWRFPAGYGLDPNAGDPEEAAAKKLFTALGTVTDQGRDVMICPRIVAGHAPDVLVQAARDAELLVVGSRERGGLAGALLGSVSRFCAQHARCPVVIVKE